MRDEVVGMIAKLVRRPPQSLSDDDGVGTLDSWDSMTHLQICLEMENRFGVVMDLDRIAAAKTVRDFVALAAKPGAAP